MSLKTSTTNVVLYSYKCAQKGDKTYYYGYVMVVKDGREIVNTGRNYITDMIVHPVLYPNKLNVSQLMRRSLTIALKDAKLEALAYSKKYNMPIKEYRSRSTFSELVRELEAKESQNA